MVNLRGLTDDFKTEESPNYGPTDSRFYIAISVATVLMVVTIALMFLTANTVIAEAILWLYNVFWFLGVIVMSAFLSAGWYIGLKGIDADNMGLASLGVGLSIVAYGGFGGAILSMYEASLWFGAVLVTSAITVGITILLSAYVFSGERDMSNWMGYSGGLFLVAIVLSLVASFFPPLMIVVLLMVLVAFTLELGFEIWYCSRGGRTPLANGFAIYFAFAGVFVHILQLVLRAMAER